MENRRFFFDDFFLTELRVIARIVFPLLALVISLTPLFSQNVAPNRQWARELLERGFSFDLNGKSDSALISFRRAAEIFEEFQAWEQARYALNGMGRAHIHKGQFEAAFSPLQQALELPVVQRKRDTLEFAKTLELLAYLHSYQDRVDSAMSYLGEAISLREAHPDVDQIGLSQSLYVLGTVCLKKGTPGIALTHLHRALDIQEHSSNTSFREKANILIAIGNGLQARGEYTSSVRSYRDALTLIEEPPDRYIPTRAACHFYLGECYRKLGEYGNAVTHLQTALQLNSDLGGEVNQAVLSCHRQLGDIFAARGDWDEAITSYRTCLSLMATLNGERHSSIGDITCSLAMALREKGESDAALTYARRALDIQQIALGPEHPDLALTLEIIGSIYAEKKDLVTSLRYYHDALRLRASVGAAEGLDMASLSYRIGSLYARMEWADSAEAYFLNTLHMLEAKPGQGVQLRSRTLRILGDISSRHGDLTDALGYYDEAIKALSPASSNGHIDTVVEFDSAPEFIAARKAQAEVLARRYAATHDVSDLKLAFRAIEGAISMTGRQRRLMRADESKFTLEGRSLSLYETAIGMGLDLHRITGDARYLSAAYGVAERSRAGVLLDALRELNAKHFAGIPDSLIEQERSLRDQLAQCVIRTQRAASLDIPLAKEQQNDLVRREFTLRNEFEMLHETFRSQYPAYYNLQAGNDITPDILSLPGAGTTLLQYFVGDRSLYIFTVHDGELNAHTLSKPAGFEDLIFSFLKSIRTVNTHAFLRSSTALHALLISPVKKELTGKQHLMIVPDGPLFAIPFEALVSGTGHRPPTQKHTDFVHLPYLIKDFDISYAYSVGTLKQQARRSLLPREAFLGIAPVFGDSLGSETLLADHSFFRGRDSNLVRSVTIDGRVFNQLPFSEQEVNLVSTSFTESGSSGRELTHTSATEGEFKRYAGNYAFVHIATHGVLDEEHPALSALLFAPPHDGEQEDGILYAEETYALSLNAELVVLSSCESGMGRSMHGEGMLSMTRGFFYAGARNVMFSLWKVYDRHTSELMAGFYGGIHRGLSFSSALREAKLSLINNPSTAFPAKWAAFVLLGNQNSPEAGSYSMSQHNELPDGK
jgi:CHAT domain-containing protein